MNFAELRFELDGIYLKQKDCERREDRYASANICYVLSQRNRASAPVSLPLTASRKGW